jgi:hypothetical protein
MPDLNPAVAAREWAEAHFGEADLLDQRRVERLITVGTALVLYPGRSIPQLFASRSDIKAAYKLLARPEATPDALQAGHRALVVDQITEPGIYLLVEDTTEVAYTGRAPIEGLGPVGPKKHGQIGFHLHSVLAVRWRGLALGAAPEDPLVDLVGLVDQQYHIRTPRPAGEPKKASAARTGRERESQIWERESARIGPLVAPAVRWVRVADAGADIYDMLRSCEAFDHGYVIRSASNRALVQTNEGPESKLWEVARHAPAIAHFEHVLRARAGRPARVARLSVSAVEVRIRAPQRPGYGRGKLPAIACTIVRVWEPEPPEGSEPLEWLLLCDGDRTTPEQALECAKQYEKRWLIEEYHKGLKTGMGAERVQLETGERLMAAVAILSVVALQLLVLRERARVTPEAEAAESGLKPAEIEMLEAVARRRLKTTREVAMALGRLGGHMNRPSDGLPGWQTLWRGLIHLRAMVDGARLAQNRKR